MHFNIEKSICLTTGELCQHQFVMRGYVNKGDGRYFGVCTVIERGNGLWEPTAWQVNPPTNKKGLEVRPPNDYAIQGTKFLMSLGYRVSGTFELHRLKAYKRMFRGFFTLVLIKNIDKTYNGKVLHFAYVEFKEI